ncbi:DUF4280 domain-containing protein [Dysgonomonas sp. 25]|uniref:DUF4280 domain-containing protein n=1 Tax=Dysgonomonas sp. 25 TaxID=2302933 RepID=UPI0013D5002F|nr:DUF4280 domain-containing protein [Dysgonomonas sp. 25]NDV67901.1 DUF4280 domain-containing protein [Dysgonomonas sp. 25]
MGLFSSVKNFFCEIFGIKTKEEKQAEKELKKEEQKPTSDEDKQKKEDKWKDVNDPIKFVIMGGKVECQFCSSPIADLIVTSTDITMQDQPWATVGDSDGKINFAFDGVCNHPSQQKPLAPPPPCKAVISLSQWKDYSNTMVNNDNALLMKSKIPCMVSNQDLTITDCGQKTSLSEVEPIMNKRPDIVSMQWIDNGGKKIKKVDLEKGKAFLKVTTRDFTEKTLQIKLEYKDGEKFFTGEETLILEGEIDENGVAILAPKYDNIKFNKDNKDETVTQNNM